MAFSKCLGPGFSMKSSAGKGLNNSLEKCKGYRVATLQKLT